MSDVGPSENRLIGARPNGTKARITRAEDHMFGRDPLVSAVAVDGSGTFASTYG
jgi:hypothetical protein